MVTGDARIWADLGAEDRGRAVNLAEVSKRDYKIHFPPLSDRLCHLHCFSVVVEGWSWWLS